MNYYEILGITNKATTKEIKKHYYKLAKKYHPDKNNGDLNKCEEFKLLSEAYTTLSNPKKRLFYDISLKYNIYIPEGFELNNDDYERIHSYYNKIMNWTEIKFIKLLFQSLPESFKKDILNKANDIFSSKKAFKLMNISNIKYINLLQLYENYYINLFRNFDDIYNLLSKQLLIITNNNVYHIFITNYNYSLTIRNNNANVKINILLKSDFIIDNLNIKYISSINLYDYYFGKEQLLYLNNKFISHKNIKNNSIIFRRKGLRDPITNIRGDLIIYYTIRLDGVDYMKYKSQINEIFNIS